MIKAVVKVEVDPIKTLEKVKGSVQKRILKKAIKAGVKPVKDAVKAKAPKRSGALRTSISIKFKDYKKTVVGIVGPRSNYQKEKKGRVFRPVRYAHLVEFGTSKIPARHFLKTAFESNKSTYFSTVRKEVAEGIKRELAKKK